MNHVDDIHSSSIQRTNKIFFLTKKWHDALKSNEFLRFFSRRSVIARRTRILDRRLCLRGRAQFPQVGRRGKKLERSTRVCRLRRPYASDRSGQCQRCRSPRVRRRCLREQPMPRAPRESWSIGKEGRGHGRNPRWFVCAS